MPFLWRLLGYYRRPRDQSETTRGAVIIHSSPQQGEAINWSGTIDFCVLGYYMKIARRIALRRNSEQQVATTSASVQPVKKDVDFPLWTLCTVQPITMTVNVMNW